MNIEKFIAYQIESQFPALYREQGDELVSFVRAYYEFLENDISGYYLTGYRITGETTSNLVHFAEVFSTYSEATARLVLLQQDTSYGDLKIAQTRNQSIYHNRRLFEYNDIDSTLTQMLIFFKKKFLDGLPFKDETIRFTVKHIMDMYRRKGSVEGLELFFRLFYGEYAHIYYPANDILKPSSSVWKVGEYLELFPTDPTRLATLKRLPIYGSISGATAIVDRINFIMISNTLVPIVYLSNVRGTFARFDDIVYNNNTYGIVRGSLNSVVISANDIDEGSSNNIVGDIVDITSISGYGGRARVSKVTEEISGEIEYVINDGGFGYTLSNTDLIISNQSLFFNENDLPLIPMERVKQNSTGAMGIVVGQNKISAGILITSSNTFVASNTTSSTYLRTVDRDTNSITPILFASEFNDTSTAKIGTITNTENISIITDLIEDFLNVSLDSTNFSAVPPAVRPMSGNAPFGTPAITLATKIEDAFVFTDMTIGSIETLAYIDPGVDYMNDVFVFARDNIISRFKLSNQIIDFDPLSGVNISVGDLISQNDPAIDGTNRNIRGIVKSRNGNLIEITQLSFKGFSADYPIYMDESLTPITVLSVSRDYGTLPIGMNADIYGRTISTIGKITEVEIIDSGLGFIDEKPVAMKNISRNTGDVSAIGTGNAKTQGRTEGIWESKTSHLNSKKVIQDSYFYQDFSYQIDSKLKPDIYLASLKELVHVAGTKVFHKIYVEEDINIGIDASSELSRKTIVQIELTTTDDQGIVTEDGRQIMGSQHRIIEG